MRARAVVCYLLLLACLSPCVHAQELSPSAVYEAAAPSVVKVNGIDSSGAPKSQGSGVVIAPGIVVSNCHVFVDAQSAQVIHHETAHPATLLHADSARDLCSFTVEGLDAPPVQFGSTAELKIGDRVFAIGAPQGFELTLSDGLLAGLRTASGGPPVLQVTSPISPGSSGGGLFDSHGRLIGITTLYWKGSPQLNFAVPVEWVRELPTRDATRRASKLASAELQANQAAIDRARESLQRWDAYMTASDPTYSAKRDELSRLVYTIRQTLPPNQWLSATIQTYATIPASSAMPVSKNASADDSATQTRWQLIYEDTRQRAEFDRETLLVHGNSVTAWVRTTFSSPEEFAGVLGVSYYVSQNRYDCKSLKGSSLALVLHSADGSTLDTAQFPQGTPRVSMAPESYGELKLEALCQLVDH